MTAPTTQPSVHRPTPPGNGRATQDDPGIVDLDNRYHDSTSDALDAGGHVRRGGDRSHRQRGMRKRFALRAIAGRNHLGREPGRG